MTGEITPKSYVSTALPQLPLLEDLQKRYGGMMETLDEEAGALSLEGEHFRFVVERDGELHVTNKSNGEVFFLSDPTLEVVEEMISTITD